jgi:hypothetical protein
VYIDEQRLEELKYYSPKTVELLGKIRRDAENQTGFKVYGKSR